MFSSIRNYLSFRYDCFAKLFAQFGWSGGKEKRHQGKLAADGAIAEPMPSCYLIIKTSGFVRHV